MTTGFEPAFSVLTRQCTGPLCYVTMFLRSGNWTRTSRDGLTIRSFAINGYRNELPCFAVHYRPWRAAGLVARSGLEPLLSGL
jgi:hypothetical protein